MPTVLCFSCSLICSSAFFALGFLGVGLLKQRIGYAHWETALGHGFVALEGWLRGALALPGRKLLLRRARLSANANWRRAFRGRSILTNAASSGGRFP